MFILKNEGEVQFFMFWGTIVQIFAAKKDMVSVPYLAIALSYHAIAFFEKKACVSRKKNLEKFFALIFFLIKFQLPLPHSY